MNALSVSKLFRGVLAHAPAVVATVAIAVPPGTAAPGVSSQTAGDKSVQHQVTVTLKLVQVYVNAKGGQPVADLLPGDFEVIDNGRSYPVAHFEKRFPGAEDATAVSAGTLRLDRKFFLVFDFSFMNPKGILKAKAAALRFLDGPFDPSDQVGLITYSVGQGLVFHEYLTADRARLRRIVEGFGVGGLPGRAESLTRYIYASEVVPPPGAKAGAPPDVDPDSQFYQDQVRLQSGQSVDRAGQQSYVDKARQFVRSLGQLAKVLRGLPGFKNIVFFSAGVARQFLYGQRGGVSVGEWTTPEELAAQMSAYDAAQADTGLRDEYGAMIKEFRAANCPVYSVDVQTQQAGAAGAVREFEGDDSLRQFASGTGGKFFANTMEIERIAKNIRTATGAYYILGYSIDEAWDGKFHNIKVLVKRKGVNVVTQGGYFGAKPFKEFTSFEKLLHVVDLALGEAPQFQVPSDISVAGLPVVVRGWPQLLVFGRATLAGPDGIPGKRPEAYLLVFDAQGDLARMARFRPELSGTGTASVLAAFLLPLKAGSYTCSLVVRDMDTGRGARGAAAVALPALARTGLVVDPPLLLAREAASQELAASVGQTPSELFGYDAAAFSPLLGGLPAGRETFFAALRVMGGRPEGALEVTAGFVDPQAAARQPLAVSVLAKNADKEARTLLVEVSTGGLAAGTSTVEFTIRDADTGQTAVSAVTFTVK